MPLQNARTHHLFSMKATGTAALKITFTLIAGLIGQTALAAPTGAPQPTLRVTEISQAEHPFETLYCARQPVQYRFLGSALELVVDNESRILMPAIAASGARYVAPDDPTTEFWNKGNLTNITWSDQALPICAPAGSLIPPYKASGNEPFWSVTFDGWDATLTQPGKAPLTQDAQISDTRANGQTLIAGTGANALTLEVEDALCIDSMSGMPHPQHAQLKYQSNTWQGCGGDPNRLLQGVTWQVTQLGQAQTNGQTQPEINFLPNNRIAGSTGCNRFFGEYMLGGEGMQIKGLGSTRMACGETLMAQEATFLEQLQNVSGVSFDTPDTLILSTNEGEIRAITN
ncbi:MAG TPA: secreted protein containing HslJ-like protein [Pusillimonas sp.]|nr:secreted protein containing HslJ-like protein [Pusillimonas sp.]MBC42767.1 secreted protein containing HslJ-like protein [Pusillimonas sp.]HBT32372.1 secreted protein containing HslJ-like protein [Pusillimonas sp.]HCP80007.1 secreted protein containing HslJ-like protein [Pusillimonas sp.]